MKAEKKIQIADIIVRVIVLPFILTGNIIYEISLWTRWAYNFLRYGGEFIIYEESMDQASIKDLLRKLQKIDDVIDDVIQEPNSEDFAALASKLHEMNDLGLMEDFLEENAESIREIKKFL